MHKKKQEMYRNFPLVLTSYSWSESFLREDDDEKTE